MKTYKIILFLILVAYSKFYSQNIWERTSGLDNIILYSLAVTSDGIIIAGTDTDHVRVNSLFRSTDEGNSWTNLGFDLKITGFIVKPGGEILMSTLDHNLHGGIFHSTSDGVSWTNIGYTDASTSIAINSANYIFTGHITAGVFRSKDNGVSWAPIDTGLTDQHINALIVNSNDDIFVGTVFGGVCRSTDDGNSWVQTDTVIANYQILSLGKNLNGDIYAGTSGFGIFRSTDNGDHWVQINNGLTLQGYYVFSFITNSSGDIFAGTDDGVFRSTNNGDDWGHIDQGLTNRSVHSLAINSDEYVFAGTEDGMFESTAPLPVELASFTLKQLIDKIQLKWVTKTEVNNYGFNVERRINEGEWNSIGFVQGHGNSNSPKEYRYIDADLFEGGGNFQYRLKELDTDGSFEYSDVVEGEVVPDNYELSQNFPNPFNPSTTIRFSLPQATQLKIIVYNTLGEQVAMIAEGLYEAGYHKVIFSMNNLPSGTYIYRLESDKFTEVKKMSFIK